MFIRDILRQKGSSVYSIDPAATLTRAAQEMMDQRCGSLVVMQGEKLVGIFTERDLLRVAATGRKLEDVQVREGMTSNVVAGHPDDAIKDVMTVLTKKRIRHLPILDDGALVGLISIGDVVKVQSDALQFENHVLKAYIAG